MWSRIARYKYSRYQWFNLWLLLEATSTTCLNWLSCTLLAALHGHRINSITWKRWLLQKKWLLQWLKKRTIFISKTLRFILENQDRGLGIENWGLGIRDRGFPRRKEKIWTLLYYIKNLTQTISSFISLTTIPFFLNPFMFYLLLWPLHFHSFWWVFVLLQL